MKSLRNIKKIKSKRKCPSAKLYHIINITIAKKNKHPSTNNTNTLSLMRIHLKLCLNYIVNNNKK